MAGISSKAAGKLENRYKFNKGVELTNDFDLSLYETACRLYDPQIGRFWQVDEIAEASWEWTPYNFGLDNPVSFNDPLGLVNETSTVDKPKDLQEVVVRSYNHKQMTSLYWMLRNKKIGFNRVINDKLRERLERWDGISRFMEKVHAQQKEQELMALDIASWFVPVGWITKLKYVKKAVNLFRLKRGLVVSKVLAKAKPLITVLGKAEWGGVQGYEKVAAEMGYNSFQVAPEVWAAMSVSERLAANMKFLDDVIARGDEIVFSKKVASISSESGAFREELEYMYKNGYNLTKDGMGMVK